MHCEYDGTLEVLEGKEDKPREELEALLKEWKKKDTKARHTLLQALSDDIAHHVYETSSAAAAWTSLLEVYQPASSSNIHSLLRQLTAIRWDPTTPMDAHINALRSLVSELKAIGEVVSPAFHVAILQASIEHVADDNWKALMNAIDNLPSESLTPVIVSNRYLAEAERQKRIFTVTDQLSAMAAFTSQNRAVGRTGGGGGGGGGKRRNPPEGYTWEQCWRCGGASEVPARIRPGTPLPLLPETLLKEHTWPPPRPPSGS